jgi:hypothetical protein
MEPISIRGRILPELEVRGLAVPFYQHGAITMTGTILRPGRIGWCSAAVQLLGTLKRGFNRGNLSLSELARKDDQLAISLSLLSKSFGIHG